MRIEHIGDSKTVTTRLIRCFRIANSCGRNFLFYTTFLTLSPEDPFEDGVVSYVADNSAESNANGENQNPQREKVTAWSNNDRNVRKFQVDRQKDQPRQTEVIAPTKLAVKKKAAQPNESKKNFGLLPQTGDFSSNLGFFGAVIV